MTFLLASGEPMSNQAVVIALSASAFLVVLNGIYVAYEFAVIAARRSSFEEGPGSTGPVAKAARASLADLSMQLAGAQLGITIASLALGRIGEPAMETIIEAILGQSVSEEMARIISYTFSLALFTFLHLVIGEMVPKNIALAAPDATLRWLVIPYRAYLFVFRPIVALLNGVANTGCRLVGIEPRDELMSAHTPSELAAIIRHSQQGGAIEQGDAELLQGVLGFAERPVRELCEPISHWASVVLGATGHQLKRVAGETRKKRILVLDLAGRPLGYIRSRDVLSIPVDQMASPVPASFVRQMVVVDGSRPLIDVLRVLRGFKRQLAVIREDGNEPAVVSIEQLIRALAEPVEGAADRRSEKITALKPANSMNSGS